MYGELYETWRKELQSAELQKLPVDFYAKIADYARRLKEESRMLDKRTVKARLLRNESQNVRRMLREVTRSRYKKLLVKATRGEKVTNEFLTDEEEKLLNGVLPLAEAYQAFASGLLKGQLMTMAVRDQRGRVALRFLEDIPVIIGADIKPYGPFKAEDIASLPLDNAKVLIKQHMAEKVETA